MRSLNIIFTSRTVEMMFHCVLYLALAVILSLSLECVAFMPTRARVANAILIQAKAKGEVFGKAELVDMLADKSGVSKKDCGAVVDALKESIQEEVLKNAAEIRIRDLGTFKQKVSAPRVGRNPQTGEELQIKGSKSVTFSAATAMKIKDA